MGGVMSFNARLSNEAYLNNYNILSKIDENTSSANVSSDNDGKLFRADSSVFAWAWNATKGADFKTTTAIIDETCNIGLKEIEDLLQSFYITKDVDEVVVNKIADRMTKQLNLLKSVRAVDGIYSNRFSQTPDYEGLGELHQLVSKHTNAIKDMYNKFVKHIEVLNTPPQNLNGESILSDNQNLEFFCAKWCPGIDLDEANRYIQKGKEIYRTLMTREETEVVNDIDFDVMETSGEEELVALTWFLMSEALTKGQGSEGNSYFIVEDPNGDLYKYLKGSEGSYETRMTHFQEAELGSQFCLDVNSAKMPAGKHALVFSKVENSSDNNLRTDLLFIKPENFSSHIDKSKYDFLEGRDELNKEFNNLIAVLENFEVDNDNNEMLNVIYGNKDAGSLESQLTFAKIKELAATHGVAYINRFINDVKDYIEAGNPIAAEYDDAEIKRMLQAYGYSEHQTAKEVYIPVSPELTLKSQKENVSERILTTLSNLADICTGERVDLDQEGYTQMAFENSWINSFREYFQDSTSNITNAKISFDEVLNFLSRNNDVQNREKLYFKMLDAIEGLLVLRDSYKSSGSASALKSLNETLVAILKDIKASCIPYIENPTSEDFDVMQRVGRKLVYLSHWLDKSEFDLLMTLYRTTGNVHSENIDSQQKKNANQKTRMLDRALKDNAQPFADANMNRAAALEASVINPNVPDGLTDSRAYTFLLCKLRSFIALSKAVTSENIGLWEGFEKELEESLKYVKEYESLQYVDEYDRDLVEDDTAYKLFGKEYVSDYSAYLFDKLEKLNDKNNTLLIPTHWNNKIDKGRSLSGHSAPTSVAKEKENYYLFQHNAGLGALMGYRYDGKEFVGHTTVPLGPFTKEEIKEFISAGIKSFLTIYNSPVSGEQAFVNLFPKDKMLLAEGIKERPFQRRGNCAVRNLNEWIIFNCQLMKQEEAASQFIHFYMHKARARYTKPDVEPLTMTEQMPWFHQR